MTALYILGGIALLILGFLMLRGELLIKYSNDLMLSVKVLFFTVQIIPSKQKKIRTNSFTPKRIAKREEKQRKKNAASATKKAAKAAKKAEEKKKKAELKKQGNYKKKPLSDTISLILEIIKVAVSRFSHHIRVRIAKLHINVASSDAATTAILYGTISQAVCYISALLDSTSTLRYPAHSDVDIHADYLSEKLTADIEIGISLKVWQLFDIAFKVLFAFLKQSSKTSVNTSVPTVHKSKGTDKNTI